eukprot:m.258465 g.258465  ORF g.258465 m.258465 type:complete len:511 (+) comp21568_c0_seq1:2328-3860(+)
MSRAVATLLRARGLDPELAPWVASVLEAREPDDEDAIRETLGGVLEAAAPGPDVAAEALEALIALDLSQAPPEDGNEQAEEHVAELLASEAVDADMLPATSMTPAEPKVEQRPEMESDAHEGIHADEESADWDSGGSEPTEAHAAVDDGAVDAHFEGNEVLASSAPMNSLTRMLGDMPEDDIRALAALDDDALLGVLALMEDSDIETKQPCRHFLQGGCYRKNCWFSHDTHEIPCRFFAAGICRDGPSCAFLHDAGHARFAAAAALVREMAMAAAGGASAQEMPPAPDAFPELVPVRSATAPTAKYAMAAAAAPASSRSDASSRPAIPGPVASRATTDMPAFDAQWVVGGAEVADMYRRLRGSAIEAARLRNRLFNRAREAYVGGDRRLAKELSRQGREQDELMRTLHAQAAQAILSSRNSGLSKTLDLHGLHVAEALAVLESWLPAMRARGYRAGSVIAGAGVHTQHKHLGRQSHSRLLPAVKAFLLDSGFRVREGTGAMHGTLQVLFA